VFLPTLRADFLVVKDNKEYEAFLANKKNVDGSRLKVLDVDKDLHTELAKSVTTVGDVLLQAHAEIGRFRDNEGKVYWGSSPDRHALMRVNDASKAPT